MSTAYSVNRLLPLSTAYSVFCLFCLPLTAKLLLLTVTVYFFHCLHSAYSVLQPQCLFCLPLTHSTIFSLFMLTFTFWYSLPGFHICFFCLLWGYCHYLLLTVRVYPMLTVTVCCLLSVPVYILILLTVRVQPNAYCHCLILVVSIYSHIAFCPCPTQCLLSLLVACC